jgi:hypothetical protein
LCREKGNLRKVEKSEVNLDRHIWKETWRISMDFRGRVLQREAELVKSRLPKNEALRVVDLRK